MIEVVQANNEVVTFEIRDSLDQSNLRVVTTEAGELHITHKNETVAAFAPGQWRLVVVVEKESHPRVFFNRSDKKADQVNIYINP